MKELTEFIVGSIIDKDSFSVEEREDEGMTIVEVKVKPDMIGLVIGKSGNTIKAIQTLLRVRGRLENKLVNLSVLEA